MSGVQALYESSVLRLRSVGDRCQAAFKGGPGMKVRENREFSNESFSIASAAFGRRQADHEQNLTASLIGKPGRQTRARLNGRANTHQQHLRGARGQV